MAAIRTVQRRDQAGLPLVTPVGKFPAFHCPGIVQPRAGEKHVDTTDRCDIGNPDAGLVERLPFVRQVPSVVRAEELQYMPTGMQRHRAGGADDGGSAPGDQRPRLDAGDATTCRCLPVAGRLTQIAASGRRQAVARHASRYSSPNLLRRWLSSGTAESPWPVT